jgi:DNA-damage-inducible protein J
MMQRPIQEENDMAQVNIRIEDELKQKAEALFNELGFNITTAFIMFVKASIRQNGIPFELSIDPFYSEANMEILRESIRDADAGKLTEHELIEV